MKCSCNAAVICQTLTWSTWSLKTIRVQKSLCLKMQTDSRSGNLGRQTSETFQHGGKSPMCADVFWGDERTWSPDARVYHDRDPSYDIFSNTWHVIFDFLPQIWSIQAKIMGGPLPLTAAMQCLPWAGATVCKKSEQARWLHVKSNPKPMTCHHWTIKSNKLFQSETWITVATTMLQKLKLSLAVNILHWSSRNATRFCRITQKLWRNHMILKAFPS